MLRHRNRIVLFLLTLTILFSLSGCEKNNGDEKIVPYIQYSFFVAGHTYGKPGVDNIGFHPPFRQKFDLIKNDSTIQFGVLTGDIVCSGTAVNWDEIDLDVEELGLTVHFAVGNHDMSDRQLYETRYGKTYYSFLYNNDLFIILDPYLDHWNISNEQLQFLKNELQQKAGNADHIFVLFHQVLWWAPDNKFKNVKINSLDGRAEEINYWDEVEPLFHSLSVPVYQFAGDVGAFPTGDEFMYYKYDSITLIASGMGGEVRDNFVIADVHSDKTVSFRLIALNGDDINALGKLEDYRLEGKK
jgi:hypothetical protein